MAKDPAFLFYPGDYLRDTQCLSERSQVAYDRVMCEHMRNTVITKTQLNFFIKRLNDTEKEELISVLKVIEGGYQIEWIASSILKRRDYSESRAKNRLGKEKNTSSTYVPHMENANGNGNGSRQHRGGYGGRGVAPIVIQAVEIDPDTELARFPDGSTQPLGPDQSALFKKNRIKPKDIVQGLSN